MNQLEHGNLGSDVFKGVYLGRVFDVVDDLGIGRVKVRVFGIFDEPVKDEHIPWAVPSKGGRVRVGDIVSVFFRDGSVYKPVII